MRITTYSVEIERKDGGKYVTGYIAFYRSTRRYTTVIRKVAAALGTDVSGIRVVSEKTIEVGK